MKECNQCHEMKPFSEFHKAKNNKFGLSPKCKPCRTASYERRRDKDPFSVYHTAKRSWCRQRDILFDLTLEQLKEKWTGVCPILNIPVKIGARGKGSHQSAHLDRLDPEIGYTYENTNWISGRANRIKYNASVDELKSIVQWMERATTIPKGSTSQAIGDGKSEPTKVVKI